MEGPINVNLNEYNLLEKMKDENDPVMNYIKSNLDNIEDTQIFIDCKYSVLFKDGSEIYATSGTGEARVIQRLVSEANEIKHCINYLSSKNYIVKKKED